jgi:hypothetical protein
MKFSEDELKIFENSLKLAELNTKATFLLNLILITILDRKYR